MKISPLYLQIILTSAAVVTYFILSALFRKIIVRFARKKKFAENRATYTHNLFRFFLLMILLFVVGIIWKVSFRGLTVYFASFFTVAGVALFAAWSVLSNITAAIILFFYFPYRLGTFIKIIDGDNSVVGEIINMSPFAIQIELADGNVVSYPNNLAIQKGTIEYKKSPLQPVSEKHKASAHED